MDDIQTIPIGQLRPSPFNDRRDMGDIEGLAASIREHGILQPLLVRPVNGRSGATTKDALASFEVVCGHRRLAAAKLAGLAAVPATSRAMDDREAAEVQIVENVQRKDAHPLEEADGFVRLRDQHHRTVAEIAASVGKPAGYVAQRMKLADLGREGRDAFLAGKLDAARALLVARIPAALQAQAVKDLLAPYYGGEPRSYRHAAEHVRGRYMLRLADAPFDRADAKLVPAAGPCTTCPKRTGNQPELFGDVASKDTCTDPGCFAQKRDAAWQRRADAHRAKGGEVLDDKEAKRAFVEYGGGEVRSGSPFLSLDETTWRGGKTVTYRRLLGRKCPPVTLARDGGGNVRELVRRADAAKLLPKDARSEAAPAARRTDPLVARARRAALACNEAVRQALAKIADAASRTAPDREFWRLFAEGFVRVSWHDTLKTVAARRGLTAKGKRPEEVVLKAAADLNGDDLRGLVAEVLAAHDAGWHAPATTFASVCRHYGVNFKRLVAAATKAQSKPKKPRAGKAGAAR